MRSRVIRAATRPTKKAPASSFTGTVLQDEVFAPEAPSRELPGHPASTRLERSSATGQCRKAVGS